MREHRAIKDTLNLRLTKAEKAWRHKQAMAEQAIPEGASAWQILATVNIVATIKNMCRIIPKDGVMPVPFIRWWPAQKRLIARCIKDIKQNQPIRLLVHKSRQEGISTIVAALYFVILLYVPNFKIYLMAHLAPSAREVYDRVKHFYENLTPEEKAKHPGKVTKNGLTLANGSSIFIRTAKTPDSARGPTIRGYHLSEFAFFPYPVDLLTAALQCVPAPGMDPGTIIIIESTACGKNHFWNLCDQAQKGETQLWKFVFYSWVDNPNNAILLEPGEVLETDEEIERRRKLYNLTDPQVKWMIYQWKENCGKVWEVFDQEYPIVSDLAFLFAGWPAFDRKKIAELLKVGLREPVFRGHIEFAAEDSPHPKLIEDPNGPLTIWVHPIPGHTYASGWDYSEGVGADYHVGWIKDKTTGEYVAKYRDNRAAIHSVSASGFALGIKYFGCLLSPERNGPGLAAIEDLRWGSPEHPQMKGGYPNLYFREEMDERTKTVTRKIGFVTSKSTKKPAIKRFRDDFNEGRITIYDKGMLLQMDGLAWNPKRERYEQNTRDAVTGLPHDDDIMAGVITHHASLHIAKSAYGDSMEVITV